MVVKSSYVLLTNIPVTVSMVRTLTAEWRKSRPKAPLCVWDPSRLNALMKGREYLARSWTGAKEARCRSEIIVPVWKWVEDAVSITTNWVEDPLWPLQIQAYQQLSPVGVFHRNFAVRDGLKITPRTAALVGAALDPQFRYASSIAYPHAMEPFEAVARALDRLGKAILNSIDELRDELLERLPQLQRLGKDSYPEIARVLAYCVLENRWGFLVKRGLHSMQDGKLLIHGHRYAWNQPALTDIEPILDELVAAVPHGVVSPHVASARAEVASILQDWWERLWHVVSFGIDAEKIEQLGNDA